MKHPSPLKDILSLTRSHWDRPENRAAVRYACLRASQCRTKALGGEGYSSEGYEATFYHPCKSRLCSSCGYRATVQWCRERSAALPNVLYKGITFTMPKELWPFFRDNPRLAKALPVLTAKAIQARLRAKLGLRVGVLAILHTFNGKLEFNSHVHVMATAGGLSDSGTWIPSVYLDGDRLLDAWRRGVIGLLRLAMEEGQLRTGMTADRAHAILLEQERRWWSIKIRRFRSKEHFLKYAGRYTRRPPIAQRRITHVNKRFVRFWYKDKELRRAEHIECSPKEFIDRLVQHIPERYEHAPRSFGLFAPRSLGQTSSAVFAILGQIRRPRPKPIPWAQSIKRDFGRDPLLDPRGKRMNWVRRIAPTQHD